MNAANLANLNRSLFQITTGHGKRSRVCGNGFVFSAGPEGVLALTPFSTRALPGRRETVLYQDAKFQDNIPFRIEYRADNPQNNSALALLKGCTLPSPPPLSFKLPEEGAQVTCEKSDGSFPTTYHPIADSSGSTQFLLGPMAPPDYIGSAVVHEGKIIGLACSLLYSPPEAAVVGVRGGIGLSNIFESLLRGAQGSAVHPDGHKYDLPPHLAAVIKRIAEENYCPILF
jgi:hypothetical protein